MNKVKPVNQAGQPRKKYAAQRMPGRLRYLPAAPIESAPQEATHGERSRQQAVLADLLAQARALVPDPPDSPTRRACRESPLDEGIASKFREQGFHL